MDAMNTQVTHEGKDLIDRWQRAQEKLALLKSQVTGAECALTNATNALGKWLSPDDAKIGEIFCVWHGDSLISTECVEQNRYVVKVRKRGRSLA